MAHNSPAENSGLSNPSESISYIEKTAVDDAGFVVKAATTAGYVDVTGAVTDYPIGYTVRDTTTPANVQSGGDPSANTRVSIQALIPGQEAYLQLAASNSAIAVGDKIAAGANGQVDKAATSATFIMAIALEAKDATTGVTPLTGTTTTNVTIKVRIIPPYYLA